MQNSPQTKGGQNTNCVLQAYHTTQGVVPGCGLNPMATQPPYHTPIMVITHTGIQSEATNLLKEHILRLPHGPTYKCLVSMLLVSSSERKREGGEGGREEGEGGKRGREEGEGGKRGREEGEGGKRGREGEGGKRGTEDRREEEKMTRLF